jgi:hypothetical protein
MSRFIPDDHAGTRSDTAVLLIGTAKEFGIDVHEVRTPPTRRGFTISDRLADVLDEQSKPKTSGNRAAKKNSQKGK